MATIFMDPESGNDANDGLSFATRKKTFNSATLAAGSGDTVRLIASPEPFSVGAAQWTDNSRSITWSNSSNKKIDDCESGWTGVTNVTVSHPTGTLRKTGNSYLSCVIASAFTTGKLAYKTLAAPLTLSAFQQIGLYLMVSTTSLTLNLKIALCSDTAGNTVVAEINKVLSTAADGDIPAANVWYPVMFDYGAGLPATPINSIAIYANADPSTSSRTLMFDCIVACKAPGAADLIDFYSLIGKDTAGEPEWYPVTDMSENGVLVAGNRLDGATTVKPYRGTTESVTTYVRNPLILPANWSTTNAAVKKDYVTVEGGYSRTDMSAKTGETWISGTYRTYGVTMNDTNLTDAPLKNIGFAHCTAGAHNLTVGAHDLTNPPAYDFLGFLACETPVSFSHTGAALSAQNRYTGCFDFSCRQVWASRDPMPTPNRPGRYVVGRIHGHNYNDGLSSAAWRPGMSFEPHPTIYDIGKIDNNLYAIDPTYATGGFRLSGTVIENNTNNCRAPYYSAGPFPLKMHFDNMADLMLDAGPVDATPMAVALQKSPCTVRQTRIGGDPTKNRTVLEGLMFFESRQDIRHTASGFSWRFYLPSWYAFNHTKAKGAPAFPLAYVAAEAGKLVTVTCWIYIEHDVHFYYGVTNATPAANFGIMIMEDPGMGLSEAQVPAVTTTHGAWQQVTLTFTPSADGVVPIYAYGWGNGDYLDPPALISAYFDDVEVTQEA